MALAIEMASMKPSSEMMMAADSRCEMARMSSFGMVKDGRPLGISPTTAPPPIIVSSSVFRALLPTLIRQVRPSSLAPFGTSPTG